MRSKQRTTAWTDPHQSGLTTSLLAVLCIVLVSGWIHGSGAAAVMSVDLGTEWMKVGVVSPGVPMEIALNKESKRKTPAILAFRDGMRTFGEDAVTVGIRDPASAYGYLLDLLGKTIDNPIVALYRERFPYYELIADETRNTIVFKKSDTEKFSVEELIAQMLLKAKEFAQDSTQQTITECVLTVPGYFGQAERQALLASAQLANLKVLQLINDYTAVALNYGVFHRAEINETAQYFIFYDMGAYKTSAAVISYQLVKDKQTKEINPLIQVLGVGYDRTLGGLEIQLRLRDYLAAEFNAMKKTSTDVTKNPRALAKLFKEAGRLKNVLSANNDHYAQIENLIEDHDFKLQVTREKLEELCQDLWQRITKPLEEAITNSGLSLDVISQVIIFGGGTRVPKVQEVLRTAIKQELGKSLNADEAATMGAVYKAADLATGFKVKKFIIKEAVLFPIQVTFERDPGDGGDVKKVKRVLFGHLNAYPQKKMITFNKHNDDFDFHVHYGDLTHLSPTEISYLGSLNILHVQLQQIKELLENNNIVDSKGIKAHFVIDESGIFKMSNVEYVYEKEKKEDEEEGTLAKLGNTISKLFAKESEHKEEEENATSQDDKNEEKQAKESENEKSEKSESENDKTNETNANTMEENNGKPNEKNNTAVKMITVKEPVQHKLTIQYTQPLSGEAFEKSMEKLTTINTLEYERTHLESSFNALESYVIDIQQKLQESDYESCITPEEKSNILSECSNISEWLYEDIENAKPEIYEKRLSDLKGLTNIMMARHWEHEERPEALQTLDGMIQSAKKFLNAAKNMTKNTNPDKDVFTDIEIETLTKVIEETMRWKKDESVAQNKLKRYEEVRLTIKEITDKMSLLDREVKYLVNKLKIWKPKPKVVKKDKNNVDDEKKSDNVGTDESTIPTDGNQSESDSDNFNIDINEETMERSTYSQAEEEEVEVIENTSTTEGESTTTTTTARSDL